MQIDEHKQKAYFNMHDNQYDPQLIMNPPAHTAQELQLLLDILKKHTSNGEVADFGAGSGRLTIPLLKNGYSVYSIDISDKSLGNLKKLATEQSLPLPHTSHEFPAGKKFKAIVGTDILHHVNFDEYFPKLYEALEPGGKIIFS